MSLHHARARRHILHHVCTYVCMYEFELASVRTRIYVHLHTPTRAYSHTNFRTHTCILTYKLSNTHLHTHIQTFKHTPAYSHTNFQTHTCILTYKLSNTHVHTRIQTFKHTRAYSHTNFQTHTCVNSARRCIVPIWQAYKRRGGTLKIRWGYAQIQLSNAIRLRAQNGAWMRPPTALAKRQSLSAQRRVCMRACVYVCVCECTQNQAESCVLKPTRYSHR
jgi:hypothetical protein